MELDSKILAPDGIIVINKENKIIVFNEAACRITGHETQLITLKDSDFLFPKLEDRKSFIQSSLVSGNVFINVPLKIKCADEKEVMVYSSITPLTQPGQGVIGVIIVIRDIHETKTLYAALDNKNKEIIEEKNKLETIFNSLLEGTFTINNNWEITSFNRAAEIITGFNSDEALGKQYWEIIISEDGKEDSLLKAFIIDHQPSLLRETNLLRKNGKRLPVRINSAPLLDISGKKKGRVVTFEDISVVQNLSHHIEERFQFKNIIGRSKPMKKVFHLMENVINTDSTVLITGESGTGKEIIARTIHLNSERNSGPFIAINCAAFAETLLESELFGHEKGAFTGAIHLKPGRFELANDGTLFLDEIGDIPLSFQAKLLRVLENRQFERVGGTKTLQFNARIISATHRDLEKEIIKGNFREDLYYRINVIKIHLPSLNERTDDIPSLLNHFLFKFNEKFKKDIKYISPDTLKIINNYNWPGNIRELENVIEHAFVVCNSDAIKTEHLPERLLDFADRLNDLDKKSETNSPFEDIEKQLIISTLKKYKGHRNKTASALGIDKSTLWRKIKKYNIS